MSVCDLHARYRTERQQWLARAIPLLRADERVGAAWLAGSLGRGNGDDLSDVDLWVIVEDAFLEDVCRGRRAYVRAFGSPLLIEEAPQNAPPGGAYLLVLYGDETGPHQVDWYWQAQSQACIPADATLLFDRVGIPSAPPPEPITDPERVTWLERDVAFQWAMLTIAAKKVARHQSRAALAMIGTIERTLADMEYLCGLRDSPPRYKDERTDPPPVAPGAQLAALRALARHLHALHPRIAAWGVTTPDAVVMPTMRYLDFVSGLLDGDWLGVQGEDAGMPS